MGEYQFICVEVFELGEGQTIEGDDWLFGGVLREIRRGRSVVESHELGQFKMVFFGHFVPQNRDNLDSIISTYFSSTSQIIKVKGQLHFPFFFFC